MPNYMTELSPDNNTHVYQIKDKEAAPIDLLKDTVGWVGKNLLALPYKSVGSTINGITYTINADGSVTASGTASADSIFYISQNADYIEPNKEYILSGCPSGGDSATYCMHYTNNTDKVYEDIGNGIKVKGFATTYTYRDVVIRIKNGTVLASPITFYPMLRNADILDSTYEPYHESVEQTLRDAEVIEGKNLLPVPYKGGRSNTTNGITFTVLDDGTVDVNGTATDTAMFKLNVNGFKAGEKYILSGCPSDGSDDKYRIQYSNNVNFAYKQYGSDVEITIFPDTIANKEFAIWVKSGVTVNHVIFKPMLRNVTEVDSTYEPYYIPLKDSKFDRAEQRVLGAKNLIPYPYANNTQTVSGITYTINSDGSITLSGTATADSSVTLVNQTRAGFRDLLLANDVILSGGISNSVKISLWNYDGNNHSLASTGADTLIHFTNRSANFNIAVAVANGTVLTTPVTIKPMLRLASDSDDAYVPYAMTNRELTEIMTPVEGTITTEGTLDTTVSSLVKMGKMVFFKMKATGVTKDALASFASVPSEYKPKQTVYVPCMVSGVSGLNYCQISTNGYISCSVALSNTTVTIVNTSWITS